MDKRANRIEVAQALHADGFVTIFSPADLESMLAVFQACARGGSRVFEITNRHPDALQFFRELRDHAAASFPEVILGVGSVMDGATAALFIQGGARFIVSPIIDPETATLCHRRKIAWIPGAATPNEISRAESLGAEIVKIFPAHGLGGPGFIRAVLGPCPWSSLMPSGGVGVDEDSLRAWLEAGAWCLGLGSGLVGKPDASGQYNVDRIEEKVRACLESIRKIRRQFGDSWTES